jgi:hypothetical protein
MGPYIKAARWIPLGINPFVDVRAMMFEGMEAEYTASPSEHEHAINDM